MSDQPILSAVPHAEKKPNDLDIDQENEDIGVVPAVSSFSVRHMAPLSIETSKNFIDT